MDSTGDPVAALDEACRLLGVTGRVLPTTTEPVVLKADAARQFFLGYAQMWRSKKRDEAARQALSTDPHSPAQLRTDAVVNNLDEFYTTWNIKPGDPAYLPPELPEPGVPDHVPAEWLPGNGTSYPWS